MLSAFSSPQNNCKSEIFVCISLYLALAEGEAGVDVLTVNPLQEAAAAVERRRLLPRLEVAEQLTVHLHARQNSSSSYSKAG